MNTSTHTTNPSTDSSKTVESLRRTQETLTSKGNEKLKEGKSHIARSLSRVGEALQSSASDLKQEGNYLAEPVREIGEFVGKYSQKVQDKSLRSFSNDLSKFCRENPAIALGTCLAAGVVVSRFMKSATSSSESEFSRNERSRGTRDLVTPRDPDWNFNSASEEPQGKTYAS